MMRFRTLRAAAAALTAAAILWTAPAAAAEPGWFEKAKIETAKITLPAWRYVKQRFSAFSSTAARWYHTAVSKFSRSDTGKLVAGGISGVARTAGGVTKKFNTGEPDAENKSVVHLKNGSSISCEILAEDARHIVVLWEGGEVTFNRSEILSIEKNRAMSDGDGIYIPEEKKEKNAWPYAQNPVVRLANGQTLDARVSRVEDGVVLLKETLGTGSIDHEIRRDKIEAFAFKPVVNAKSDAIGAGLRKEFLKMKAYEDGAVTLLTDSEGSSLKALRRAIAETVAAVYLDFFELLGSKEPQYQLYVVVFDKIEDYAAKAASDGVPAEMCPGYFSPEKKTLYMVNYFGDHFSTLIYEAVGGVREGLNEQGAQLKSQFGDRHSAQIDGAVQDAKSKMDNASAYIRGILSEITLVTLRHEVTHEMLHSWGVQTILVSKQEAVRKAFETPADAEAKKELILQALGMEKGEGPRIEAANSWFVEGVAEYASTTAVGLPNNLRLFGVKDARAKNELLPLEHLTVYKMGSFPGVSDRAALSAYAQSWSLVEYLMKEHRAGFMKYLERMARERPSGDEDLKWLLEATGQELRTLENGWHAHIDALPQTEDPAIAQWIRVREILGIK